MGTNNPGGLIMTRLAWLGFGALLVPIAACDDGGAKEPITIGMSVSLSGADAEFGATMQSVMIAAVEKINDAGGADGHDLVVLYADDETSDTGAAAAAEELIAAGVVGIVGPFNSGPVEAALELAIDAEVPVLSPSSTAPRLALPTADDGWLFRTAPNDNFQSLAMAHYFEDLVTPAVETIAIVHESGSYGEGLANSLDTEWVDVRDHTLTVGPDDGRFSYEPGLEINQAAADALWAEIEAAAPTAVVMIGLGTDINAVLRTWLADGGLPDLEWFFSDSAKASSIFGETATALPAGADGLRGTAPTSPKTSIAFQTFVESVQDVEGIDVSDQGYTQNTWDAVYLLALALTQQSVDGDAFGGDSLREALIEVSSEGQVLHAGQWRDLVQRLRSGGDVDYDGAGGPVDFTTEGETVSPYEVWALDIATESFELVEYIETTDL